MVNRTIWPEVLQNFTADMKAFTAYNFRLLYAGLPKIDFVFSIKRGRSWHAKTFFMCAMSDQACL